MNPHKRKKQPEQVRQALLQSAGKIALERGLAGLTLQAVADAAGVTKGGLLHHFPSKEALMSGLLLDLFDQWDAEIEASIAQDANPYGRFTRAYVEVSLNGKTFGKDSPWMALLMTSCSDMTAAQKDLWHNWLQTRLKRHQDTDNALIHSIVRFAADGAWLSYVVHNEDPQFPIDTVRKELLALTYQE